MLSFTRSHEIQYIFFRVSKTSYTYVMLDDLRDGVRVRGNELLSVLCVEFESGVKIIRRT